MPAMTTFAQLADALESEGVEVGIALSEHGHAITLRTAGRALRFPVHSDFDAAAEALVLSAQLQVAVMPLTFAGRRLVESAAYDWPELQRL